MLLLKSILLLIISVLLCAFSYGQKRILDSAAVNQWPSFGSDPAISNDGNYFSYVIERGYTGNELVVQSTCNSWERKFVGAVSGFFSSDSKELVFQRHDSLFLSHRAGTV